MKKETENLEENNKQTFIEKHGILILTVGLIATIFILKFLIDFL